MNIKEEYETMIAEIELTLHDLITQTSVEGVTENEFEKVLEAADNVLSALYDIQRKLNPFPPCKDRNEAEEYRAKAREFFAIAQKYCSALAEMDFDIVFHDLHVKEYFLIMRRIKDALRLAYSHDEKAKEYYLENNMLDLLTAPKAIVAL